MFKSPSLKQKIKDKRVSLSTKAVSLGLAGVSLTGGASAATINVTAITGIITDMGSVFPALGDMVVNIVPTLLVLAVVGFIFKFFDKILAMIEKMI